MILILVNTFDLNEKESYKKHKKQQQQQPSSITQNLFAQYFGAFGGSRSNLPNYYCCCNI